MTRKELEQLRGLHFEIETLTLEADKPEKTWQVDWYKDYRHNPKGTPKTLAGYDDGKAERDRLERRLLALKKRQIREINRLEEWIEHVDDSTMRTILRMYYRDGMKYQQIGKELGYSVEGLKSKVRRFWKEKEFEKK